MKRIAHGKRALTLVIAIATMFMVALGAQSAHAGSTGPLVTTAPVIWGDNSNFKVEGTTKWFVELQSPPAIEGTSASVLKQEKDNFRAAAKSDGVNYTENHAFDTLWNGISVEADKHQVASLANISGVKAIYPVMPVALPPTQPISPQDISSLPMIGADVAQSELGYTGAGIRVGIIDTGIDYTHPDLGHCTQIGPPCRVAYGYDFVGDAYDANTNPHPVPDPDPRDCAGHGTHVAGIIGANGNPDTGGALGVAPGVTFGVYRVFGCQGSTDTDIILRALERAYSDHMQVINMSLGAAFESWPQYPDALASSRLVDHGVVVVAAAGNSGDGGTFAVGSPSVGDKVISVASYDNTHLQTPTFTLNPAGTSVSYLPMGSTVPPPTSGTTPPLEYVGGRGCLGDPYPTDLAGKVAVIKRGVCTFDEKYQRAIAAGAVGVVIFNRIPGPLSGGGISPVGDHFAVGISLEDGLTLLNQLAHGPVTLTWTAKQSLVPVATGGLISSFSSYGLAADLSLKPDLGAPGGLIRSTIPVNQGSYAVFSGTSMATPHVTGAAALYLQAHPATPAASVRDVLQNTASPKLWSLNTTYGILDDVQHQGAGMIQIDKAIQTTSLVTPAKLSLGASSAGPSTQTLTLVNNARTSVTYNLSHDPAISTTGSEFAPDFDTGFANVAFSAPSVTVPAGGSSTVTVTITANPDLADGSIYDGYLTMTPRNGGQVLHVPYAGYKGNYQAITVLSRPTFLVDQNFNILSNGGTFTMQNGDVPAIAVHFNHAARQLRMEVFDAKGHDKRVALIQDYLSRNSTSGSYFVYPWDGTTAHSNLKHFKDVKNGDYTIQLSVLKALGNPDNPSDWETWTSPTITIARPGSTK